MKKKYTVGVRHEYCDEHSFIKVEAVNAFQALKEATKIYKKNMEPEDRKDRAIYPELIFKGHVECIYNDNGWGASDEKLKSM